MSAMPIGGPPPLGVAGPPPALTLRGRFARRHRARESRFRTVKFTVKCPAASVAREAAYGFTDSGISAADLVSARPTLRRATSAKACPPIRAQETPSAVQQYVKRTHVGDGADG